MKLTSLHAGSIVGVFLRTFTPNRREAAMPQPRQSSKRYTKDAAEEDIIAS